MEAIAKSLSSFLGLPLADVLAREDAKDQRKLGREGRKANLEGGVMAIEDVTGCSSVALSMTSSRPARRFALARAVCLKPERRTSPLAPSLARGEAMGGEFTVSPCLSCYNTKVSFRSVVEGRWVSRLRREPVGGRCVRLSLRAHARDRPKSMPDEGKGIHVSQSVRGLAIMARPRSKPHRSLDEGRQAPRARGSRVADAAASKANAPVCECGVKYQVSCLRPLTTSGTYRSSGRSRPRYEETR